MLDEYSIHHIGYCVTNLNKSIEKFRVLGFSSIGDTVEDTSRNVKIQFMKKSAHIIELIAPLNLEVKSPVDRILSQVGSTPYHLCFEVVDIEKDIEPLKKKGFILIEKPRKALAIGNSLVAFMFANHVGLIELVQLKRGFSFDRGNKK